MLRLAGAALAIIAVATAAVAGPLSPSELKDDIKKRGAKAVVSDLFRSGAWENVVLKEIESGSAPWIDLAPALSAGTDAATSEGLGESLIYALPKAPEAVLAVIDLSSRPGPRAPDTVCSASFYEGDPTDPRKYRIAALQAVNRVSNPALKAAKSACLDELQAVR
jgi:hypothetical protein